MRETEAALAKLARLRRELQAHVEFDAACQQRGKANPARDSILSLSRQVRQLETRLQAGANAGE